MAYRDLTSVLTLCPLDPMDWPEGDIARDEMTQPGGDDHRPPAPDSTPVAD